MKKLLTNFNKKEFKHINYFSIVACVNDLNSKEGERTIFGVVEPPYNIIDLSKAFCKIDNFSLDNKKLYGNVTYLNNLRYGEFGRRLVEECKFGFKLVYTSKSFQDATYMSQILTWYIDINKQQTNVQPNKEDYDKLLNSGMFWEFHPELSGDWNKDKNLILDIDTKQEDNKLFTFVYVTEDELFKYKEQYHPEFSCVKYNDEDDILFIDLHY